jgi:hypothetical protein
LWRVDSRCFLLSFDSFFFFFTEGRRRRRRRRRGRSCSSTGLLKDEFPR